MEVNIKELARAKRYLGRFGTLDINFTSYGDETEYIDLVCWPEEGVKLNIIFDGQDKPVCGLSDKRCGFDPLNFMPKTSREDFESFFDREYIRSN